MKVKLLFVLSLILTLNLQSQSWQWAARAGGIGSEKANDMSIDNNGNSYIGGYYNVGQPASYSVNFGPFMPAANYGKEGFIAKIDKNGNWIWAQGIIGGYDERVLGVHVDKQNNYVYTAGTYWDWGGLNMLTLGVCVLNTTSSGGDNIFVSKSDLNGNCQWLLGVGGGYDDHGYDITSDIQGNAYLTAFISSPKVGFGPDTLGAPPGDSVCVVAKISPSGNFLWARQFGNCDGERDNRIAIDNQNNVYVAGGFHGTKAFGTTTLTSLNNSIDVFVTKYDQFGNHIWAKRAGGILDDRVNGITVDALTQKIYVTGEFRDYAYFDLDTINNNGGPNGRDIFAAKMDRNGNWLWAKKAGSKSGDERGNGICSNSKGNIFITGQITDTAKFGPVIQLIASPTTTTDVFVAAIDSLGKWHWAIKGGTVKEDRGTGIACDDSCNIYTSGYYEGAAAFGTNTLAQYGKRDVYAARINSACFNYVLNFDELFAKETSLIVFPNPANDFIEIKFDNKGMNSDDIEILFLDVLGRNVNVSPNTNTKELSFNISHLSQGVYSINLISEGKTKVVKFVKQ